MVVIQIWYGEPVGEISRKKWGKNFL